MVAESGAEFVHAAEERPLRRAVVIYESQFGKTRRVAEAFARGVANEAIPTDVFSVEEAKQAKLDDYDLFVLGCPAHFLTGSPAIDDLLKGVARLPNLRGRYGFAFETRLRHHPGGAASHIQARLTRMGLRWVQDSASGVIETPHRGVRAAPESPPSPDEYHLEAGAELAFEHLGAEVVRRIHGELKDAFDL